VITGICDEFWETFDKGVGIHKGVFKGKNVPARYCYDISKNIQALPDYYNDQKLTSITTSFGCHFRCDFCATHLMSRKIKKRRIESIVGELKDMIYSDVLFIRDENFLKCSDWKERLELIKESTDKIYLFASADMVTKETVRILKKNRVWMVSMGMEDITMQYPKNRNLHNAIKILKDADIFVDLSFIINPSTLKNINEEMELFRQIKRKLFSYMPERICGNFLIPFPGTMISKKYHIKPNKYRLMTGKSAILSKNKNQKNRLERMLINIQLDYFMSSEYNEMREFQCGDTLHDIFIRLLKK
jgi:radical SAM superfamily enzyme YgiQ (UPF0313 family)